MTTAPAELLEQLSTTQLRFAAARLEYSSDAAAALSIGITPTTVYHWPERHAIREVIKLFALQSIEAAGEVLRQGAAKAALVKLAGLDSPDERIRQATASEILKACGVYDKPPDLDLDIDFSKLTDGQLARIAGGEDIITVLSFDFNKAVRAIRDAEAAVAESAP